MQLRRLRLLRSIVRSCQLDGMRLAFITSVQPPAPPYLFVLPLLRVRGVNDK